MPAGSKAEGWFDPDIRANSWFDIEVSEDGWYDQALLNEPEGSGPAARRRVMIIST